MALSRSSNKRVRSLSAALVLSSWADRPRTLSELEDMMAAQGVPEERKSVLRKAWLAGGILFFLADTMSYATATGVLTASYLRREFARSLRQTRLYMRDLGRRYVSGDIDLSEFQRQAEKEIEDGIWDAALLLVGPLIYSLSAMLNTILELIRRQKEWLARLVADILSGRQAVDGTLLRRIAMYSGSGWSALQELSRQLAYMSGKREERNILGIAEHCAGCVVETGKGWVPIGTLVPVGERDCLSNCMCEIEFR